MAKSNGEPENTAALSTADDADALRKKISSLYFDGSFADCVKMIDENMRILYEKERWPDIFFTVLRTYQRCYLSLNGRSSFEEHITAKLRKSGVPFVFAALLRGSDESIVWNADYFKDLAVLAESGGDLETALSYCDLALKLDPANVTACVVRGWILDDSGKPEDAAAMFERAIKINASSHIAWHSLAKHYGDSNPSLALENIDKAIALAPSEGPYYETKSRILLRAGDKAGAIACLDAAMAHAPYNADYPYEKGEILLSQGKEMAAIAQYRKAMSLNERHVASLWRLASLYRESQPELSLTYINTVISLEPENRDAIMLRATLLAALGNDAEAAEQFGTLIENDPGFHEALAAYAALLVHSDPEEALVYYTRAISAAPKIAGYHMGKARAHEELGQIQQAIKEYRHTLELDARSARAWARLGSLLAETRPREAVSCYDKAIAIMPANAFYHTCKGEILMGLPSGRREAIKAFENALRYDQNDGRLHAVLGVLLEETARLPEAEAHYKQAVNLGYSDADTFYRLARLVLKSDPGFALLHINGALRLDPDNGEYYYFKSRVLNVLGHDKHASEQLSESLRAAGDEADMAVLAECEDPQAAILYINRAIESSPGNPDYICARGNLFFSLSMPEKALAQYEAAMKLDPKHSDSLFGAGRCIAASSPQKALTLFNKSLASNPANAACHAEKSAILENMGKLAEALASIEAAINLDGENASYHDRAGALLEALGRPGDAIERYRKAAKLNPGCIRALARLGGLLAKDASLEALSYINQAIELEPFEYSHHILAGSLYASRGDMDAAISEYRQAARLGGETPEVLRTLADMLCSSMPEAALGYCHKALETQNADAACQSLCGKIHLELGQKGEAISRFKEALRLNPSLHEPIEKIAEILCENSSPGAEEAVDAALKNSPACVRCLFLKATLLAGQTEEDYTGEAIECLDKALKLDPKYTPAREKLVELLQKKRSFIRLAIERRKLGK